MPDKSIFRNSKRNWLIIIVICLLSIAVIVFLEVKSNDEIEKIVQKQFSERQLLLSKQISSGLSEFLNEKTTVIEVMAMHISDSSPKETLTEFENVYNQTSDIYVFEFINESGIVTMGYPRENTPYGYDIYKFKRKNDTETEHLLIDTFEWVRNNKKTNISRPVRLIEGGFGAFIWTPVYKGNEFKGVILTIITISDISDKFLKNNDSFWDLYLIDDRGGILYNSSNKEGAQYLVAPNSTDPLLQHILRDQLDGKEGIGYYFENNGTVKNIIAYSPIIWRNQKWSVSVVSKVSEVHTFINSVYAKQSLFLGVAVGLIIFGSFSIIFFLSRWNISLEHEVKKKTNEISNSNKLLEDANKKLIELDKLKSDFLSMVSHELKTPLTAMKTSSEMLLEDTYEQAIRKELIQILIKNIERMTHMVDNLLKTSMIESGNLKYNKEMVAMDDIISTAVGTLKNQYEKKGLSLTTDIPGNLPKINADKDRIIQVFINILNNALKFSHEGGAVEIKAFEFEKYIEVHVKDDGVGIPPDKIEKIFDKFYQIDNTSTRSYNGMGLGLAISKGIMEGHGGSIRAESILSKGSVFILTFNK